MKIFFKRVEINKPTLIYIWIEHQCKSRKLRTSHRRQSKCVLGLGEIIYQSQISTCQRHRPAADAAWGASHSWWKWKWMIPMMGELHTGITYPFSTCGRVFWNIRLHSRVCQKMQLLRPAESSHSLGEVCPSEATVTPLMSWCPVSRWVANNSLAARPVSIKQFSLSG